MFVKRGGLAIVGLALLLAGGSCAHVKKGPPVACARESESPLQAPGVLQTSSDRRSFDSSRSSRFDRFESSSPFPTTMGPWIAPERLSRQELLDRVRDQMRPVNRQIK